MKELSTLTPPSLTLWGDLGGPEQKNKQQPQKQAWSHKSKTIRPNPHGDTGDGSLIIIATPLERKPDNLLVRLKQICSRLLTLRILGAIHEDFRSPRSALQAAYGTPSCPQAEIFEC